MHESLAYRRRVVARTLKVLAVAATLAEASPAEAQEGGFTMGGGAYVGVSFGSDYVDVGWGFEVFGTGVIKGYPDGCGSRRRGGIGPSVQLAMVGLSPRVVIAAQGGGELGRGGPLGLTGELGLAIRPGEDLGFGVHTGLVASAFWAHLVARAALGLDEYTVGAGPRINHRGGGNAFGAGPFCTVTGRPLSDDDGVRSAPHRRDDLPDAAARAWAVDADAELASVPAFVQLARDLLAAGAPAALVEAAVDAAEDELRHAQLCADLASRYAGRTVRPHRPTVPRLSPHDLWRRLVLDGWRDGCVGEGAAARVARRAARSSRDPRARQTQAIIARDEARHAELAWKVLAWALRQPGATALADALQAELHRPLAIDVTPQSPLLEAGQLGAEAACDELVQAHAAATRRAAAMLAA